MKFQFVRSTQPFPPPEGGPRAQARKQKKAGWWTMSLRKRPLTLTLSPFPPPYLPLEGGGRWGWERGYLRSLLILLFFILPTPAHAVQCYSALEAEAEQAIRIHSELMVIGLNCQHRTPSGEKNYYYQYKDFTLKNGDLFAGYERALMAYYTRVGLKNPEGELNQLRTQFANQISGDAAKMRPDLFCAHYAPRIPKASTMTTTQIRTWASTFFRSHPLTQPICANVNVRMK